MDFIKAEEAISSIASFLKLDPIADQDKLFLYLDMAQKRAWKSGSYKGFTREASLKIREFNGRRFINTPHGFNVLLGLNLDNKPKLIFESYFQFHHNGPGGTYARQDCYQDVVLEYRESATLMPYDLLGKSRMSFKLAALAHHSSDVNVNITATGLDINMQPVNTTILSQSSMAAGTDGSETIYGAQIKLEAGKLIVMDDVNWLSIDSLHKPVTNGAVDFYAIFGEDCVYHIATIQPFQQRSLYRTYEIPHTCCLNWPQVDALLKIGEPEKIKHVSQSLIIDDLEALLAIVMSIDETFDKKAFQTGMEFMTLGISSLDAELRSSRAPTIQPVQVMGMDEEINSMNEYSL